MSFVGKVCSRKIFCIPLPANDDYDVNVVGVDVGVGVDVDDVGVDVQRLQERFFSIEIGRLDAFLLLSVI